MKIFLIGYLGVLLLSQAHGAELNEIFLKNGYKEMQHVWVNGYYQGFVRPGDTCYVSRSGFMTYGSDRSNGEGRRTAKTHSHGGWAITGKSEFTLSWVSVADWQQDKKKVSTKTFGAGEGKFYGGFGGVKVADQDIENAIPIHKGNLENLATAKTEEVEKPIWSAFVGKWNIGEPLARREINTVEFLEVRLDGIVTFKAPFGKNSAKITSAKEVKWEDVGYNDSKVGQSRTIDLQNGLLRAGISTDSAPWRNQFKGWPKPMILRIESNGGYSNVELVELVKGGKKTGDIAARLPGRSSFFLFRAQFKE